MVADGMAYCPNCGMAVMAAPPQGSYPVSPPPVHTMAPQYAQGPYPPPGYLPAPYYYNPPNPKRTAAGGACVLMIIDGALALLFFPIAMFNAPVLAIFLLVSCLVAIVGGIMALKGILPLLALAGPPLLIISGIWLATLTVFFIMVSLIGIVLACISMAMVVYGWSDLQERVEMRRGRMQMYQGPPYRT